MHGWEGMVRFFLKFVEVIFLWVISLGWVKVTFSKIIFNLPWTFKKLNRKGGLYQSIGQRDFSDRKIKRHPVTFI